MFGKHHLFKLAAGIAVAASIAGAGARASHAGGSYNPDAYVYGGASPAVAQAIQAAGFSSTREISVSRREKKAQKAQAPRLITDTLGGNGHPKQFRTTGGNGRAVE